MAQMVALKMPKWGLSMQEGKVVAWAKPEGAEISEGEELVDIETSKITNVFEAPSAGVLRRIVAQPGETLPVGGLIAVLADAATSDSDIDAFVAEYQENFRPGEETDDIAAALSTERVEAGEWSLRVGRSGAGTGIPVLLLHGYSGDMNSWLFNLEALAEKHPLITLDLPGHGESDKSVGDGSLATLSSAVLKVLDALDVKEVHVVGHSLGGAIAARLAADHPGRVRSVVMICPVAIPGTSVSEEFLTGIAEAQRARDVKAYLEMLFADPGMVSKDMVEGVVRYKRIDGSEEALSAIRDRLVSGVDAQALADDLSRIKRATIIASAQDRVAGKPDVGSLPSDFTVHWIEESGHMPHMERASEVNEILARVLE